MPEDGTPGSSGSGVARSGSQLPQSSRKGNVNLADRRGRRHDASRSTRRARSSKLPSAAVLVYVLANLRLACFLCAADGSSFNKPSD